MQPDFFGNLGTETDQRDIYKKRRQELVSEIKEQHSHVSSGVIILFAAYEMGCERFRQDKTFFYYSGINEPGTVLVIDLDAHATLYIPHCFEQRSQWLSIPQA